MVWRRVLAIVLALAGLAGCAHAPIGARQRVKVVLLLPADLDLKKDQIVACNLRKGVREAPCVDLLDFLIEYNATTQTTEIDDVW